MHILGKVLLGFMVFLLVPAAILLTTMALDVRSKWQAEIEQRQNLIAETTEQLREARVQVNELEGQVQRATFDWGEVWDAPNSQPLPGGTGVQLGVGRSSGLGENVEAGESARVYVFAEAGNLSNYLGEFELVQIDRDRAAGELLREPYSGETQSWPRGKYHVRDVLPSNWLSTIADLESQVLIADSKLAMQQEQERILTKQLRHSQNTLDQRLAELSGDANAPPGANEKVLDGLVETLRKLENERNQVLDDVHNLRVKLVRDHLDLQRILAQNEQAVEDLQANRSDAKPPIAAGRGSKQAN